MIDYETVIYDQIVTKVGAKINGINFSSTLTTTPASFPFVYISERGNVPTRGFQTQKSVEDYSTLTYEVQIFSNKRVGRKMEARTIAVEVDNVMRGMNMNRISLETVDNYLDADVYRIVGRYSCVISADGKIYRG